MIHIIIFAKKIFLLFFVFMCVFLLWVSVVQVAEAQQYDSFTSIPFFDYSDGRNFADLINALYIIAIALGSAFGILKIAFAGVKYSMSDVVSSKQSAKDDIKGVFFGLFILLTPFIILNTINPALLDLNIFGRIETLDPLDTSQQSLLPPLEEGQARGTCVVGSPVSPDYHQAFSFAAAAVAGYAGLACGPLVWICSPVLAYAAYQGVDALQSLSELEYHTDESCTFGLQCDTRGESPGTLSYNNNKYTCTYSKKIDKRETTTLECGVTETIAKMQNKTVAQLCLERCNGYKGGDMDPSTLACTRTTIIYKD